MSATPRKNTPAAGTPNVPTPNAISADTIAAGLSTRILGRPLHVFPELDSTNAEAFRLAERGAGEGTLVIAEHQTKGRGRLGRAWHSPAGLGLWLSLVLRPNVTPAAAPALSLVAGLSLARTIEDHLDLTAELKWPNDCLLDGKKTAGMLIELSAERRKVKFAVLGVGINVLHQATDFPPALQKIATSLAMATSRVPGRIEFLCAFLRRLEDDYLRFKKDGLTPFLEPYQSRCGLIGATVRAQVGQTTLSGRAVRIDPTGALVIVKGGEETAISAGEVERIR